MAKKYADIKITLTVEFEDDGELDLKDQAMDALLMRIDGFDYDAEVIGEVRDTPQG